MNIRVWLGCVGLLGCLVIAGCTRGPFRSVVVGDHESATVQWSKPIPLLAPLSVPAGVMTDIALVPLDTAALLSINCVWRPLFDNAAIRDATRDYVPAVVPNVFVFPFLAHLMTLGTTWDYYVDLLGNQTEWQVKRLIEEGRYCEALEIATTGCGVPTIDPKPKLGLFWACGKEAWKPVTGDTEYEWRKQWTQHVSALLKKEVEQRENALKTAASPEEWDNAASELDRLGVTLVSDETDIWRALSVWRQALSKQDYETALGLLRQYPSVRFDGLPIRYSECISKGYPQAFRTGLYEAGVLRFVDTEDYTHLLKHRDEGILTHARFSLPFEAAEPALNGTLEAFEEFLDATKGAIYQFAPVQMDQYTVVNALVEEQRDERLRQAVEQKLVQCDAAVFLAFATMGKSEVARQLWSTSDLETQGGVLSLALDEKDPRGEELTSLLPSPSLEVWEKEVQAFERLCRQKDEAMRQRIAALQQAGWVSEEKVKEVRLGCAERESKPLLERLTVFTASLETPQDEEETALLTDFPEFEEVFIEQKQKRLDALLANHPLEEILNVALAGNGDVAVEMLKRNPSITDVSPDDVALGIMTECDALSIALIQRCKNLNGTPNKVTPLMAAACSNRSEIVSLLLSRKVNVNRKVSEKYFISWFLALDRRAAGVKGVDDKERKNWELNFLNGLVFVALVSNASSSNEVDALDFAVNEASPENVRALLAAGAFYDKTPPINPPLALAIRKGDTSDKDWAEECDARAECALAILNAGAEANVFVCEKESDYSDKVRVYTVLLCAIRYTNSQDLVRELVRKGAPVSLEAANAAIQKDWDELGQWLHRHVRNSQTENDILADHLVKYLDEVPWIRSFLRAIR